MNARFLSMSIVAGACLVAALLLQLSQAPKPFAGSVLLAVGPFAVLACIAACASRSRLIPAACAGAVVFSSVAAVFHWTSPSPSDLDSEMYWIQFLVFGVPMELLLAAILLLGALLGKRKGA
jgi:hypothetical protein